MDLVNFSIARNGTVSLPAAPTWVIAGQVVDSDDHAQIVRDFSGANAVNFPQVLGNLSAAQQDDLVKNLVSELLVKRFGVSL